MNFKELRRVQVLLLCVGRLQLHHDMETFKGFVCFLNEPQSQQSNLSLECHGLL